MVPVLAVAGWLGVGVSSAEAILATAILNFAITATLNFGVPRWLPRVDEDLMRRWAPEFLAGEPVQGTRIRIFEGFDERSAGLMTLQGRGDCLEPDITDRTYCVFDRTLPVRTGDIAHLACDDGPGLYRGAKRIERAADGRILAACNEGVFEVDLRRVRIYGRLVATIETPDGMPLQGFAQQVCPQEALDRARREHNAQQRVIIAERQARRGAISRRAQSLGSGPVSDFTGVSE